MQQEDIRLLKSSTLNLTKELDQMKSTMVALKQQSREKDESIKHLNQHITSSAENARVANSDDDVSSIEVVQAKASTSSE